MLRFGSFVSTWKVLFPCPVSKTARTLVPVNHPLVICEAMVQEKRSVTETSQPFSPSSLLWEVRFEANPKDLLETERSRKTCTPPFCRLQRLEVSKYLRLVKVASCNSFRQGSYHPWPCACV